MPNPTPTPDQISAEALRRALGFFTVGGGLGAASVAVQRLLSPKPNTVDRATPLSVDVLTVPDETATAKKRRLGLLQRRSDTNWLLPQPQPYVSKRADATSRLYSFLTGVPEASVAPPPPPKPPKPTAARRGPAPTGKPSAPTSMLKPWQDTVRGVLNSGGGSDPGSRWWAPSAYIGGGAVGFLGARHIANKLFDGLDKRRQDNELDKAQQEYLAAIQALSKTALDLTWKDVPLVQEGIDAANKLTGTGLALYLSAAVPSALLARKYVSGLHEQRVYQEALLRRQQQAQARRPASITLSMPDAASADKEEADRVQSV